MTTPATVLRRRIRDMSGDQGSTLAAVLMVLMVVMAIGLASVQTAQHSNDMSSVDRERLQAVQAAEAGVHEAIKRAENGLCEAAVTDYNDLMDGGQLVGQYRTQIDNEVGDEGCASGTRLIKSWGYAPTGGTRALRHLEVTVKLVPKWGFPYALFAEGGVGIVDVQNNAQINGDVYADVLDQSKNNLSATNVVTPDTITTKNNATYSGTLWAGGDVNVGNGSSVGGSVLAAGTPASGAGGDVVLGNGSTVGADVLAKGSVTLNGSTVNGSVSDNNNNVPAPEDLTKPSFTWNAANYSPAPVQGTAATITSTLSTNKNSLSGTYYNNSGSASSITIPDGAKVTGDLTIVSSGRVILGNGFTAVGGPWTVIIVAQSTASNAIDVNKAMTSGSGISLLLYTLGGVDMKNATSLTGAVYANQIALKNNASITAATALAEAQPPGFSFIGTTATTYSAVPTLWREVVPGLPPE